MIAVDALQFERQVREGRQALRSGDPATAVRTLGEALGLWRGDALADVADAPFATAIVARLSELRLSATEDRVAAELELAGDHSQLVAELEALTAAHPLRVRLRVLLIKALHAGGRQSEALAAFEDYRRLVEELGSDPGAELQEAHLAVLRGEQPRDQRRGNLRAALTGFVGRDEEQARIVGRLEDSRLVTLVAPGGCQRRGRSRDLPAA